MKLPDTSQDKEFEGYERIPQETQFELLEDQDLIDYSTQFNKKDIKTNILIKE